MEGTKHSPIGRWLMEGGRDVVRQVRLEPRLVDFVVNHDFIEWAAKEPLAAFRANHAVTEFARLEISASSDVARVFRETLDDMFKEKDDRAAAEILIRACYEVKNASMYVIVNAFTKAKDEGTSLCRGADGTTPLMHAAYADNAEMVRLLYSSGADPHARDVSGRNAFIYAARSPSPRSMRALIAAGLNPSTEDTDGDNAAIAAFYILFDKTKFFGAAESEGDTRVHLAFLRRYKECAEILAGYNVDINVRSSFAPNLSAFEYAACACSSLAVAVEGRECVVEVYADILDVLADAGGMARWNYKESFEADGDRAVVNHASSIPKRIRDTLEKSTAPVPLCDGCGED